MKKIIQEPPPLVRLKGKNGLVIYPKMVPDGKGGWTPAEPELLKVALTMDTTNLPKYK